MRLSFSKLFPWHPTPEEYAETLRADAHRAMLESMQRQYVAVSRTAPTLADLVDAALKGLDTAGAPCSPQTVKERPTVRKTWKLKRTRQCSKCPWKVSTDPYDIPNGYCEHRHAGLADTIAEPGHLPGPAMKVMACHESPPGAEAHCIGWLVNQIGPGNNIGLRLMMMSCENARAIKLDGEQHETFEDTLPV